MSEWSDGYVAAALHDLKKVLLNNKAAKDFGTWRPDHADLTDLGSQLDNPQQRTFASTLGTAPFPPKLDLENSDQVALIRAHHRGPMGLPAGSSADLQLAALALEFADRAHKALYFWGEGSGEIRGVNWRCPWYYPFWGEGKPWTVPEAQERFLNVAKRIRQHLDNGGRLEAEFLVTLGEGLLSDFGDSTFLPVTSLHFHHQLSAAIYLLVMKELSELGHVPIGRDRKCNDKAAISLHLTRTVITLPPERLRYRLRDAMHLRKISQHMLVKVHQHLSQQYLPRSVMGVARITHPAQSPLVFYGKEAIVILNRGADDKAIMQIVRDVANETETPIKIDRQPLELRDDRLTPTGGQVAFNDLTSQQTGVGPVTAKALDPEMEWAMPKLNVPDEAAHECAACHGPIAPGRQREDLDDDLCETCYRIRREYQECPKCFALFPQAPTCPFCGDLGNDLVPRQPVSAGRLIRLLDELGCERVAIIAVRIGATPDAMSVESELRLAQFREERNAAEESVLKSSGLTGNDLQQEAEAAKALMPLAHGTGGVLEYLQAVLEIERHQDEWLEWLTSEGRPAQIVYLSPAFMVLLAGESWLAPVYQRISRDLEHLHLPHRLDVVTCDTHYPIYDALAPLFSAPGRQLQMVERPRAVATAALAHRQHVQDAYRTWRSNMKSPPAYSEGFRASQAAASEAAADEPNQGLSWRVLRGGNERIFTGDLALRLLEVVPSKQSASQLHAVASLAESLAALSPDANGAFATLVMDVDGRRDLTDAGRDSVLKAIAEAQSGKMSLAVLAQYLRELARATRPT